MRYVIPLCYDSLSSVPHLFPAFLVGYSHPRRVLRRITYPLFACHNITSLHIRFPSAAASFHHMHLAISLVQEGDPCRPEICLACVLEVLVSRRSFQDYVFQALDGKMHIDGRIVRSRLGIVGWELIESRDREARILELGRAELGRISVVRKISGFGFWSDMRFGIAKRYGLSPKRGISHRFRPDIPTH
jgi:hypothetical protein